jgi:pimeloyl-ACP methyl ester carboxylesterase
MSMGGYCALHLAIRYPERCRSITVAGAGYGAHPSQQEPFRAEVERAARSFETDLAEAAARYAIGPTRVRFRSKDPHGWSRFADRLAGHDPGGMAGTLRGVLGARPSLFDMQPSLERLQVPTLVLVGDEDEGCLDAGLFLKRTIPAAALAILPNASHTLNLEEPERFNADVGWFLDRVELGRWGERPESDGGGLVGMIPRRPEANSQG